jgi:toxin ParE1/3/4
MSIHLDLLARVMDLPANDRAELAWQIILILEPASGDAEADVDAAWQAEVEHRAGQVDRGEVELRDWRNPSNGYGSRSSDRRPKTLRLHPELQAAAQWYEDRVAGLGERFLIEAVDALALIERHPGRSSRMKHRSPREIRRRMLDHFPYAIIYEVGTTECIVLAVAHAARKPGYWRGRLT